MNESSTTNESPFLLILTDGDCRNAINAAFDYAKASGRLLRAVRMLHSDLYHYGHHDLVASRHSKREFLLHIRNEVIERGNSEMLALKENAERMGISFEASAVESEDINSSSLAETKKGYDMTFIPKQEKRLFPLFKRTLSDYLQKKAVGKIIAC